MYSKAHKQVKTGNGGGAVVAVATAQGLGCCVLCTAQPTWPTGSKWCEGMVVDLLIDIPTYMPCPPTPICRWCVVQGHGGRPACGAAPQGSSAGREGAIRSMGVAGGAVGPG